MLLEQEAFFYNLLHESYNISISSMSRVFNQDHTTIIHSLRNKEDKKRYWSEGNTIWDEKNYKKKICKIKLRSILSNFAAIDLGCLLNCLPDLLARLFAAVVLAYSEADKDFIAALGKYLSPVTLDFFPDLVLHFCLPQAFKLLCLFR